jgi:hypothetical protein
MNIYHLNIVVEGDDSLIVSYDSLNELRANWIRDAHDFLVSWWGEFKQNGDWYLYVTCENENGDIEEISLSEIEEAAA